MVYQRQLSILQAKLLRLAYVSLIRSQLEYCSAILICISGSITVKEARQNSEGISSNYLRYIGVPRDVHSVLNRYILNHWIYKGVLIISSLNPSCSETVICIKDIFTVRSDGALISSRQPCVAIGKRRLQFLLQKNYMIANWARANHLCYTMSGRWTALNTVMSLNKSAIGPDCHAWSTSKIFLHSCTVWLIRSSMLSSDRG